MLVLHGGRAGLAVTVEEEGGPSLIGSCVPAETTRIELVRAFTNYGRVHRAELDLRATRPHHPGFERSLSMPAAAGVVGSAVTPPQLHSRPAYRIQIRGAVMAPSRTREISAQI